MEEEEKDVAAKFQVDVARIMVEVVDYDTFLSVEIATWSN